MRRLDMWADLHCPYAYLAAFRLRRAIAESKAEVEVRHLSLAIEYADDKCTPYEVLATETPILMAEEPKIPYQRWDAAPAEWPVTMWPAFEAVKCAERQDWRLAHELDWALRKAFFAESRCISMRHVIFDVARSVRGLDLGRFESEWDAGLAKGLVIEEARRGWNELKLEASPTFVLPDGARKENPAAPLVELDEERNHAIKRIVAPTEDAQKVYRALVKG